MTTEGDQPPKVSSTEAPAKKRLWPLLLIFLLVTCCGGGTYYYYFLWPYESTDDAFIEASVVRIGPRVTGSVVQVHVKDNQPVKANDLLVEIDPQPFQVKLEADRAAAQFAETRQKTAQAAADLTQVTTAATLEQAQAEVEAARAGVEQARAEVAAAEAEAKRSEKDVTRYERLEETAVSRQRSEVAGATAEVAAARLTEARKAVAAGEAKVAAALGKLAAAKTGPQQVAVALTQVEQAAAGMAQARVAVQGSELELSYAKVYAPVAGHIAKKSVHVGETVQAGQALMAVVPEEVWVVANFKESQFAHVHVGQPVEIRIDAYSNRTLKGHVDSFQEGTGSRFSLLPPENATGNYVKVVQRLPVKILFDEAIPPEVFLAPGMSVVPKVRVR